MYPQTQAAEVAYAQQQAYEKQALGGAIGSNAIQSPPLFLRLVKGAEELNQSIALMEDRLRGLMTRACGPMPEQANAPRGQDQSPVGGHLGALDSRLTSALHSMSCVHDLLVAIERVI